MKFVEIMIGGLHVALLNSHNGCSCTSCFEFLASPEALEVIVVTYFTN